MPCFTIPIHEHGDPNRPGPYPHGKGAADSKLAKIADVLQRAEDLIRREQQTIPPPPAPVYTKAGKLKKRQPQEALTSVERDRREEVAVAVSAMRSSWSPEEDANINEMVTAIRSGRKMNAAGFGQRASIDYIQWKIADDLKAIEGWAYGGGPSSVFGASAVLRMARRVRAGEEVLRRLQQTK